MSSKGSSVVDLVKNRKALHEYEILETFEAGIMLKGTEIKSLRNHGGSLQQAYVKVIRGELWLVGAHIAPYTFGNIHNHEEQRDRKLLVHKRELAKMHGAVSEKGLTLIPLAMYLVKGWCKIKIALARGRKSVDKRHVLKEKDEIRNIQKAMKDHGRD